MTLPAHLAACIAACEQTHPEAEALRLAWLAEHDAPKEGPQLPLLKEADEPSP